MKRDSHLVVYFSAAFAGVILFMSASVLVGDRIITTDVEHVQAALAQTAAAIDRFNSQYDSPIQPDADNFLPEILAPKYLEELPHDPFTNGREHLRLIVQIGFEQPGYIIGSVGPDRDWDLQRLGSEKLVTLDKDFPFHNPRSEASRTELITYLAARDIHLYDPTNGAASDGDIIHLVHPKSE